MLANVTTTSSGSRSKDSECSIAVIIIILYGRLMTNALSDVSSQAGKTSPPRKGCK